jgi:hypothetical protein
VSAKPRRPVAPLVREALVSALGIIEQEDGKAFQDLLADAVREHGILEVLSKLSKYMEREHIVSGKVDHEHRHKHVGLSATSAFIAEALGQAADGSLEELGEDGPLLLDQVSTETPRH